MNTHFFHFLLIIALCGGLSSRATAQDSETEDPAPGAGITPDPALAAEFAPGPAVAAVRSSSIIAYSDGLSASIEFGSANVTVAYLVNAQLPSDTRSIALSNGSATISGLPIGKLYDIKVTGSDGRWYIVGQLNTTPYQPGGPVKVSEPLYRALSQYVAVSQQNQTLSNYLKQLNTVSQHEKISFLQRYVMNGATLPATLKGQYPDTYTRLALEKRGVEEGECLCNFVMNEVTTVKPDEDGFDNLTIKPTVQNVGPVMYNNASFWFRGMKAQGPAKYLHLENAGTTAGNKRRTETWTIGSEAASDLTARTSFNLLCVGINELPRSCDCTKQVRFDYGYYSNISARSNTGGFGCIFEQEAAAAAQDWAVAFITKENVGNVNSDQVLASSIGTAGSECKGGISAEVLVDILKIGTSVFEVLKGIKSAAISDGIGQLNQLIDKIGAVLTKLTETKDCGNAIIDKPLVQGNATITFHPNEPMTFVLMTGSVMQVVGKRCWQSTATIKSSFHLASVFLGGTPSPNTGYCCTDYLGNWAYGSYKNDESNRRSSILNLLQLNSPGGWPIQNGLPNPSGQASIPTQIGYVIGSLPDGQKCAKDIPFNLTPK